jgi:cytochrome c biogenesis protein CcmG/thiol:disulfide interchange protein DsbE
MGCPEKRTAHRVRTARCQARRFFRPAVALAFLCVSVAAETFLPSPAGSQAGQTTAPTLGAAAVGFELKTLAGEPLRLEKFRGRPLIMNFFASWCDPCREEMPLINELASKANENGYAVLGIAIQDRRASVMEFAREAKALFPVALDLDGTVQRAYRVFGPPATFFVDAQGVLRDVILGPMTPERARQALEKVGVNRSVLAGVNGR